jgi:hypothetical protein
MLADSQKFLLESTLLDNNYCQNLGVFWSQKESFRVGFTILYKIYLVKKTRFPKV